MIVSSGWRLVPSVLLGVLFCCLVSWSGQAVGHGLVQKGTKEAKLSDTPGLTDYISTTKADIVKMTDDWKKLPKKPISFGCNLILAHGSLVNRVSPEVLEKYADAIKESGATRVDFNPVVRAQFDAEAAKKYKVLAEHIRKRG